MTTVLLAVLPDSNILLHVADPASSLHTVVEAALSVLRDRDVRLCISSQNLIEFWAVATRPPERNGLGLTPQLAREKIESFKRLFPLVPDTPKVYEEWERWVLGYKVSGKQAHEARLVAVMKAHGISHMLTFDTGDFRRYAGAGLAFLHPNEVAEEGTEGV